MPPRKPKTKEFARAEAAYRAQLKKCGFRSWRAANRRRCDLINQWYLRCCLKNPDYAEFMELQKLADLYLRYKDFDGYKRREKVLRELNKKIRTANEE